MSNKLIIKNSFLLYIRLVATMFIGILTSRYVLGALGASDFGLYNVVSGIVHMMAFVNTIMVSTTYRYIAFELGKADGDVNRVFNTSLTIHIAISLVAILIAFTAGLFYVQNYLVVADGKLPDAVFAFCFSILNTVCVIIGTPFQGLLVAKEKFTVTVPIEIFTKLITLVMILVLPYLPGNHLRLYVVFITLIHLMNPLLYIWYCVRNYYESVKWRFHKRWNEYKSMLGFSGWIMIGVASSMGEHQGSAMIINRFFGTILNASFGIANQVNSMVQMFSRSLGQAVVPQITKSYGSGDHKRSSQLVILSSKFSFFLMLIPMLPILLETDFILNLWLKDVPQFTKVFVQVMLIKSLVLAMEAGIPTLINASGKIKYFHITSSVIMLLCLPIAFFAFKLGYPPYTISYIYMFTSLLSFIATLLMLKMILNYDVKEFIQKAIVNMMAVIAAIIPLFFLTQFISYGLFRFVLSLVISELVLFLAIFYLGMDGKERASIMRYLQMGFAMVRRRAG